MDYTRSIHVPDLSTRDAIAVQALGKKTHQPWSKLKTVIVRVFDQVDDHPC